MVTVLSVYANRFLYPKKINNNALPNTIFSCIHGSSCTVARSVDERNLRQNCCTELSQTENTLNTDKQEPKKKTRKRNNVLLDFGQKLVKCPKWQWI